MKKIFAFIRRLFMGLRRVAQSVVKPSIEVVELLKKAVESPAAPIITAIIPGTWDNRLAAKLRQHLPRVLQILRVSDECLKLEAADEIIQCAVKKLREYEPQGQAATYHNIAALLSYYMADGKLTWREAVHLSEEVYQQKKEGK